MSDYYFDNNSNNNFEPLFQNATTMDDNEINQYQNISNSSYAYTAKPKGLNLYQIPIFELYNPKTSTVVLQIDTKTGDLSIVMAPAIPGNSAINQRGPIEKGTLIYDYNKKQVSNFTFLEVIDLIDFLKSKFINTNSNYSLALSTIRDLQYTISQLQIDQNYIAVINDKLNCIYQNIEGNSIKQENNQNNENKFGIYRKRAGMEDKAWNFVYDESYKMLYINFVSNSEKMRISLSGKMVHKFIEVLESYSKNYTLIKMLAEIGHSTSRTLAFNNIVAPIKEHIKNFD